MSAEGQGGAPYGASYGAAKMAILEAAAGILVERGPRGATLRLIAERVGITEPAIFRHFSGIEGLFGGLFAVYESLCGRILSDIAGARGQVDLARALAPCFASISGSRNFAFILLHAPAIFAEWPELRRRADGFPAELSAALDGLLQPLLPGLGEEGRACAVLAARGMAFGLVSDWLASGFAFDLGEALGEKLSALIALLSR